MCVVRGDAVCDIVSAQRAMQLNCFFLCCCRHCLLPFAYFSVLISHIETYFFNLRAFRE